MKSKDLQKVELSKYHEGHKTTKFHRHLNGQIGLTTIKQWCQMRRHSASIKLSSPTGDQRFRNNEGKSIQKIKQNLRRKKREISSKIIDGPSDFREKCSMNNEKRFRAMSL